MIARGGEGRGEPFEQAGPVMADIARLAVHQATAHDMAAEMLADGLMAEADAQQRPVLIRARCNQIERDARLVGCFGSGRDQVGLRARRHGLSDAHRIVADNLHFGAQFHQIMDEVPGEAIVIVDDQNHGRALAQMGCAGKALNRLQRAPLTQPMTYQDRPAHFSRIRRWLHSDAPPPASAPLSWQERLFREVGAFLFDNGLDPTPDNYDLAFQFRAAQNQALVNAIRTEMQNTGALSRDAADRIFAENAGPVSAEALARMAADIESQMDGLSGIARKSGDDAAEFRTALESDPGDVSKVVELTRAMISRTRNAEAELRKSTRELQGLRAHLAEAQHFADVDPLTELANRRAFKRDLEKAIVECRAKGQPLSLAFCDIDHFKRLNDLHGHETGDRVLRFVAQLMAKQFARKGTVGRFGGEEFVVMFPAIDPETARLAVDKCRAALADLPLYAASSGDRIGAVTFTAGVSLLQDDEGMAELLRRADETLYKGKAEGRNRVLIG